MEHFFQDYLESQIIWSGLLLLTFALVKFNFIQSIEKPYQLLRNVFLSFPLIFFIKLFHFELPFSIMPAEKSIEFGSSSIVLDQQANSTYILFIASILSLILIFKIYAYWKSNTIKKNTKLVDDKQLIDLFENVKKELHLTNKQIKLKSDISIGTPYCFGFSKFNIVIPEQILEYESRSSIRTILLHELNHIKQRDTIFLILEECIQLLSLLNPISYFIQNKINEYREHRCDQDVLNTNLITKQDYAKTLLDIKLKTQHGYWPIPVAQLTTQSSNLERRIKSMKKLHKKDSKIKIAISTTLIISSLLFLSCENKTEAHAAETENEVIDVVNSKVDLSKMSPEERRDYKLKLAVETEVALNREKKSPALFELKNGTAIKFGESNVMREEAVNYFVKDKNSKEHHIAVIEEKANNSVIADKILQKIKKSKVEKNSFKLREIKEKASDPKNNVKFGTMIDKVDDHKLIEVREQKRNKEKN